MADNKDGRDVKDVKDLKPEQQKPATPDGNKAEELKTTHDKARESKEAGTPAPQNPPAPVPQVRVQATVDQPEQKYKRARLDMAHLYNGLRYLAGVHVIPAEMKVRKGEVLDENVSASEYKVPDQSVEEMFNIQETIAPVERAPIGGDTTGRLQQVPDDTPIAGGKSKPSATATSGSDSKDK